jgi:hypothetical protein
MDGFDVQICEGRSTKIVASCLLEWHVGCSVFKRQLQWANKCRDFVQFLKALLRMRVRPGDLVAGHPDSLD